MSRLFGLIPIFLLLAVSVQALNRSGSGQAQEPCGRWVKVEHPFRMPDMHFFFWSDSLGYPDSVFVPEKCKPDTACWKEEWELELRLRNMPEIVWDSESGVEPEYDSVWYHIRRKVPCPVPDSTGSCDSLRPYDFSEEAERTNQQLREALDSLRRKGGGE